MMKHTKKKMPRAASVSDEDEWDSASDGSSPEVPPDSDPSLAEVHALQTTIKCKDARLEQLELQLRELEVERRLLEEQMKRQKEEQEEELEKQRKELQRLKGQQGSGPAFCQKCAEKERQVSRAEAETERIQEQVRGLMAQLALRKETNDGLTTEVTAQKGEIHDLATQLALQTHKRREVEVQLEAQKDMNETLTTEVTSHKATVQNLMPQIESMLHLKSRVAPTEGHFAIRRSGNFRCEDCNKLLQLDDWFRCHECENCNFCRACFETETYRHARGTHSFSDMGTLPHVFNNREKHQGELKQILLNRCDVCRNDVYPDIGKWFRCNDCVDYNICSKCWDVKHLEHREGAHTFTEMCTLLPPNRGFPKIKNEMKWFGKLPYRITSCAGCKKRIRRKFFHCNDCPRPGLDLCQRCIVTTDLWHSHSSSDAAPHTFSDGVVVHSGGRCDSDDDDDDDDDD